MYRNGASVAILSSTEPALRPGRHDQLRDEAIRAAATMCRLEAVLQSDSGAGDLERVLVMLGRSIERRNTAGSGHCERLGALSVSLGVALELSGKDLLALYQGAFLHDIGKIAVADNILFKPGPLTPEEWKSMHRHPLDGERMCQPVAALAPVLPIIRSHHERQDGSGYPDGLAGRQIPLLAQVLQVADVFDALTSGRPYKHAYSPENAIEILYRESRKGWRDAALVRLLEKTHTAVEWQRLRSVSRSLERLRAALLK